MIVRVVVANENGQAIGRHIIYREDRKETKKLDRALKLGAKGRPKTNK